MVLEQHKYAICKCKNREDAEYALEDLYERGFPIHRISIVAKEANFQESFAGSKSAEEKPLEVIPCASITGSVLGAIGGCLIGLGLSAIPGVGAALAIGTIGTTLASTLAGVGAGILSGSAISCLGCSKNSEDKSKDRNPSESEYLVMVDGTDEQLRRAESIVAKRISSDELML